MHARTPRTVELGLLMLLLAACGAGGGGSGDGGESSSDGAGSSGAAGQASASGGTGSLPPAAAAAGAAPIFETDDTPAATEAHQRCQKIDFLYVVDNSPSMTDKQANLARSFPGFMRTVDETLGTSDHHIMVIDTDDTNVGDILVGGDSCSGKLGAGLRAGSEGQDCGIDGAQRFLLDGQDHLGQTFACLAQVGIFGNADERPIDALLTATGALSGQLGDCNEGFSRADAVLVVTLITDEEDVRSQGDPATWKRTLAALEGGNPQAIVMLGLLGDNPSDGALPGGPCDAASGASSPRLASFVESFELGALGSVCAPDYSQFFADAVSRIDTACDVFVPPR